MRDFCFLLCSERSGGNLITRLVDGHSAACGPSPTHLFRTLIEHRAQYADLTVTENWHSLLSDTVALANTKLGAWSSSVSVDELKAGVESRSLAALLRFVYEKEADASGAHLVFVKENHMHRHFAFLERAFPACKFVFLVRDPRDMALSWKRAPNLRGGVIRAAETWKADQVPNLSLYHALAGTGRMIGMRYEDLIKNTEERVRSLCRFFGIEFEPAMLELDHRQSDDPAAVVPLEWANLKRSVITDNNAKYRTSLSREEVQFVEATCGLEMRALGYPRDFSRSASPVELRGALLPLELHEKPAYQAQDGATRQRHAARARVMRRLLKREPSQGG